MRKARTALWQPQHQLLLWVSSPLDPILHPSPWRLRLLGLTAILGQPLFGWIWTSWYPQPYESIGLRVLMCALGGVLMLSSVTQHLSSTRTQILFTAIVWIEFPLFFSWMYLCNGGNTVWLATVCAMILIYHHLTDWRIATIGTIAGAITAGGAAYCLGAFSPDIGAAAHATNAVVIAFSWGCALLLGMSSADLRREQLSTTLTAMGIMAHELRTPLSTAALLGDAIQFEVQRKPDHPRAQQLEKLGQRLHMLVRNMNHQIDTQIANAKLLQLPRCTELVSAAELIQEVLAAYPFQSSRQRDSVKVLIQRDFTFRSASTQFSQVMDNLIKNALHSLMAADSKYHHGALLIEVGIVRDRGRISVVDDGMGIDAALLPHIFKPFFSSNRGTGHGLGLAFCQQVVQSAGGSIYVKSEYAIGAVFTIELPMTGG